MARSVERVKLRDVAARGVRSLITERGLRPGDRLPTETELAARFGVSRPILREATKSLEFLGLLEARPGRGLTVGRVDLSHVRELIGSHPALVGVSARELIDSRVLIETGVLPQVARNMKADGGIHDRLRGINDRLATATAVGDWIELDIAFHRELISSSGLGPMMAVGDVLTVFFQRFRESVEHAAWPGGVASHSKIIDSLRAGRVRDAERELRTHIESHRAYTGVER